MTCNPQAYLQAAKEIQQIASSEGCFRATANRGYYAVFHRCKEFYSALPRLGTLAGKGEHEQLINLLKAPSNKMTEHLQDRSVTIGKYLREMCDTRVHADYEPGTPFTAEQMNEAMDTAEMIFACAAVTKGPVTAQVAPLLKA